MVEYKLVLGKIYATEFVSEDIDFGDSFKKIEDTSILNGNSKTETKQVDRTDCEVSGDDDLPF